VRPFRFTLFADELHGRKQWQETARRAEDLGFAAFAVGDHIGLPSPFPALVSAAAVTTGIRLGTRVLNAGLTGHPLQLARDVATTDLLVDGRLEVGLGIGWSRTESDLLGVAHPPVAERAARLEATVGAMLAAFAAGGDEDIACHRAIGPRPLQRPAPPIMIGGHGDAVLGVAARCADSVGFTGATVVGDAYLPTHVARADLGDRIAHVRRAAGARFAHLELGVKIIVVALHGRAEDHAERLSAASGLPRDVIRNSPFALLGPPGQVVEELHRLRAELGISSVEVPSWAAAELAPVVAALAG
jgi:probable F420-dependent oxidoreductase